MAYRFKRSESPRAGFRRIAGEQIAKALAELNNAELGQAAKVHQVRKRLKKLRALLWLVRPGLGKRYRRLDTVFRDLGRELSVARDAEVRLVTADAVVDGSREQEVQNLLATVNTLLKFDRNQVINTDAAMDGILESVGRELEAARLSIEQTPLKKIPAKGLLKRYVKIYKRSRKGLDTLAIHSSDDDWHQWRKALKHYWYQTLLLEGLWPAMMRARARELRRLTEWLGQDHDRALLRQFLEKEEFIDRNGAGYEILLALIDEERRELKCRSLILGSRICAEPVSAYRRRLATYWRLWKD